MARLLYHDFCPDYRKYRITFLALTWLIGLLIGICSLRYTGEGFLPLIRMAVSGQVPLPRLLAISYLPCVLSLFAIWVGWPQFLIAVCFFKAWLFGLVASGCIAAFGSAGWLIGFLFFFREGSCMALVWWLWIIHPGHVQCIRRARVIICFAVITGIVCLEYCYISPFLVSLLEL